MSLAPRFAALFAGLTRAYGTYSIPKKAATPGTKVKGRALTVHEPVTEQLWEEHLDGKKSIGIVPIREDGTLQWGAIDVDIYPLDLSALEKKIAELMLPLVLTRSKSGGAQLYLFCSEPMSAQLIRGKLTEWAITLGYPGVEIFPKQVNIGKVDTGNWLNMPYFHTAEVTRYCLFNGQQLTAEEFLDLAEQRKRVVTKIALEAFIAGTDEILSNGPPCLEHLSKVGFPRGSRNKGLFNLGVLARFAVGDGWVDQVELFNRRFMQPPLSSSEVVSLAKSLGRKNYFYTCTQDPIVGVCSKEICKGRKFGIGNTDTDRAPVVIDNITKIDSSPPLYIVSINGKDVQCTASDLLQQGHFRRLVMEKTDTIIPVLKAGIWDAMLRDKFEHLTVIEAPVEAGPEGQMLSFLQEFCTSWVKANSRDEIILGKPWLSPEDAHYYFRATDLEAYLEHKKFRAFTGPERWAILKRHCCTAKQMSIKGITRNVWRIPAELFTMQTIEHDIPRIPGAEL